MGTLTADDIFAATDLEVQALEIPEWGGTVYIRVMTGAEREQIEKSWDGDIKTKVNVRAQFVARLVCDEDGERIFEEKHVPEIAKKSCKVLEKICTAGLELNKMGEDAVEQEVKDS